MWCAVCVVWWYGIDVAMSNAMPTQGNVPIQLKTIENDSNMTKQGDTGWMDSLDPLYAKICDIWMKILIADFGTDHVCPCSPRTAQHCTFAPLASWPASAHTPHCSPRHHRNGRIANSTPLIVLRHGRTAVVSARWIFQRRDCPVARRRGDCGEHLGRVGHAGMRVVC